jgi:hypothetical protein
VLFQVLPEFSDVLEDAVHGVPSAVGFQLRLDHLSDQVVQIHRSSPRKLDLSGGPFIRPPENLAIRVPG